MTKRALISLIFIISLVLGAFAQQQGTATQPAQQQGATTQANQQNPAIAGASLVNADTAMAMLKEYSVEQFENQGSWYARISSDEGITQSRLFDGQSAGSASDPKVEFVNASADATFGKSILGSKTSFFRRGFNDIYILNERPISVDGIVKTLSVWVAGRNFDNVLWIIIEDFNENRFELPMGKLNFQGWKKLSVAIPPASIDGKNGVIQRNFHYSTDQVGIRVVGFRVACGIDDAYGHYFIYFDDLRAVTDIFALARNSPDDPRDNW